MKMQTKFVVPVETHQQVHRWVSFEVHQILEDNFPASSRWPLDQTKAYKFPVITLLLYNWYISRNVVIKPPMIYIGEHWDYPLNPDVNCSQRVPNCHATRRKHEGWDTARLPKPRQGKSRGRGRGRTTDLPSFINRRHLLRVPAFDAGGVPIVKPMYSCARFTTEKPSRTGVRARPDRRKSTCAESDTSLRYDASGK
ncbi:hypothetical protein T265_02849 [Opisthorchis viverrini]|uniref:Uncharacterized protein n=1 Tax=Opisthorchis viverrini TaxID=6198 RepID=A0A075A5D2_OPIVI|nr:hypothetical protein T265_02849 [Opisthorchis viverrini]KER30810.1 hypothetical protein T265_02849 [Opisthorchis viverrini]